MANTIIGNCFVIDSAGVYLTGSNATATAGALTGDMVSILISDVRLVGAGSTSEMGLSLASALSTDIIHMKVGTPTGGSDDIHFTTPFSIGDKLYVRLLTAGTGYIYFS